MDRLRSFNRIATTRTMRKRAAGGATHRPRLGRFIEPLPPADAHVARLLRIVAEFGQGSVLTLGDIAHELHLSRKLTRRTIRRAIGRGLLQVSSAGAPAKGSRYTIRASLAWPQSEQQ